LLLVEDFRVQSALFGQGANGQTVSGAQLPQTATAIKVNLWVVSHRLGLVGDDVLQPLTVTSLQEMDRFG
jgi:hypothetical protein